jgi:hypothetical protein
MFARWKKILCKNPFLDQPRLSVLFVCLHVTSQEMMKGFSWKLILQTLKKNSAYIFVCKFEVEDIYTKLTHVSKPLSKRFAKYFVEKKKLQMYFCLGLHIFYLFIPSSFTSVLVSVIWLLEECRCVNPLQTKRRPLYLKTQSVPRCKHFSSGL